MYSAAHHPPGANRLFKLRGGTPRRQQEKKPRAPASDPRKGAGVAGSGAGVGGVEAEGVARRRGRRLATPTAKRCRSSGNTKKQRGEPPNASRRTRRRNGDGTGLAQPRRRPGACDMLTESSLGATRPGQFRTPHAVAVLRDGHKTYSPTNTRRTRTGAWRNGRTARELAQGASRWSRADATRDQDGAPDLLEYGADGTPAAPTRPETRREESPARRPGGCMPPAYSRMWRADGAGPKLDRAAHWHPISENSALAVPRERQQDLLDSRRWMTANRSRGVRRAGQGYRAGCVRDAKGQSCYRILSANSAARCEKPRACRIR